MLRGWVVFFSRLGGVITRNKQGKQLLMALLTVAGCWSANVHADISNSDMQHNNIYEINTFTDDNQNSQPIDDVSLSDVSGKGLDTFTTNTNDHMAVLLWDEGANSNRKVAYIINEEKVQLNLTLNTR